MPTVRHRLPSDPFVLEIVWETGSLGGAALAVVDVLRLINRIAALDAPAAPPPVGWRWVRCDGTPMRSPAFARAPAHERSGEPAGRAASVHRSPADVIVLPGWMARDGPEIDTWIVRCNPLVPRMRQTLSRGGALLAVYTGVVLLAAARCLRDRRFAAPWPFFVAVMRHASESGGTATGSIGWSDTPDWHQDRGVWTCASPVATTEAVLDLLGGTSLSNHARAARDVLIPSSLRQTATVAYARSVASSLASNRLPDGSVERARRWLVEHLCEPYDVRALARAAATSARTLARHFSATHGTSPYEYLERLRVERACMLLQTTHLTVEEVGHSSGLPSPSTFRRVFAKHTGTLPREFRQRYRLRPPRPRWGSAAMA
jgi:transcriptional regulator GlxA family with amidase domain